MRKRLLTLLTLLGLLVMPLSGTADTLPNQFLYNDAYQTEVNVTLNEGALWGLLSNDNVPPAPSSAAIVVDDVTHGNLTLNPDGSFSYTPDTDYAGSDSFTYEVYVGNSSLGEIATVTLEVDGPPVATDIVESTPKNTPIVIDLSLYASDPNDDIYWNWADIYGASHGSIAFDESTRLLTYTPDTDFVGVDVFAYDVADHREQSSNTASITITVTAPNQPPLAEDDNYSTLQGVELVRNAVAGVLINDSDPDNDTLSAALISDVSNGSLTLNSDGSFTYTPDTGFSGNDSFVYSATDPDGASDQATATISVAPVEPSEDPTATDDNYSVDEGQTLTVSADKGVLRNDRVGEGGTLTATKLSNTTHGSISFNSDGSFTYTPEDGFTGIDSFTYQVTENAQGVGWLRWLGIGVAHAADNQATVKISVNSVNAPPVAEDDSGIGQQDQSLVINVLENDSDPDDDVLSIDSFSQPANGSVVLNDANNFLFTPSSGWSGETRFTYTISDGALTDTATVSLLVRPAGQVLGASVEPEATVTTTATRTLAETGMNLPVAALLIGLGTGVSTWVRRRLG